MPNVVSTSRKERRSGRKMSMSSPTSRPRAEYDCEINCNYDSNNVNYVLNANRNVPVVGEKRNSISKR